MKIKIMLDAGHYTKYNQGAYKSYYEGDMTFKLQTYLKAELESYGFYVGVTKTSVAQDMALSTRGNKAKGYDLFLSLHSNACSTPSVKRVVVIKGYDQGDTLAAKFGKCISETMGIYVKYQIMTRKGSTGGEYYGVLRGAKAVGVNDRFILEHGFHTNEETAKWLCNDDNLKKLAEAEAKMIAEHYGYKKKIENIETGIYKITVNTLNIRKGPATTYDIVGTVKKSEAYTIVETKGNWGKLKSGAGWVYLDYCTKIK